MWARWGWGLVALALLCTPPLRAQPPQAVAAAIAMLGERPHAGEEAWRGLSAHGLPLIEPHPDDDALARVTFAFKTAPSVRGVRLDSVIAAPYARQPVTDYVDDFTLPLQSIGETGIWWITLDVPREIEAVYSFLVFDGERWQRRSDPHNPRHLRGSGAEAVLRLDRAPDLAPQRPWPSRRQREPEYLDLESGALDRRVTVQLYRNPDATLMSPLLVIYDAFLWGVRAPVWEIAANLAEAGDIPPVNLVLIDQLDPVSETRRYDDQVRFLADELLPALAQQGLEPEPEQIILAGASRRGLAAARAALQRPEAFGGVISLSGSFYWAPEGEAAEWLGRDLPPAGPRAPHFYLAAGQLEYVETSTNGGHVMLDTNRRFGDALTAAGYEARLEIFPGGHDIAGWRHALADGLVALLGEE